jgi:hypothetical protein
MTETTGLGDVFWQLDEAIAGRYKIDPSPTAFLFLDDCQQHMHEQSRVDRVDPDILQTSTTSSPATATAPNPDP